MKFPKTLYAKIETEDGTPYFVADGNPVTLIDMGERRRLGVYFLKEEVDAEAMIKTTPAKTRSR